MLELVVELSKKFSQKDDAQSFTLFRYFLVGPLLLVATLTTALFKLSVSPVWENSWSIGFISSLVLGLWITALSFREGSWCLSALKQQSEDKDGKNLTLERHIEEMRLSAHQEKEHSNQVIESLRMRLKESEKRAACFEELTTIKKYDWEALEEEKETLFQERVSLQQDLDVYAAENGRLGDQLAALQEEVNTLHEVRTQEHDFSPPPHPYDELRKQFDEKSVVLGATRKELFAMEGKYLAIQKEMENKLLEPQQELQDLLAQFNALETYCSRLEDDLVRHQELLTELSMKKPVRKKRKTTPKKVKVESVVADLFQDASEKKAKPKVKAKS